MDFCQSPRGMFGGHRDSKVKQLLFSLCLCSCLSVVRRFARIGDQQRDPMCTRLLGFISSLASPSRTVPCPDATRDSSSARIPSQILGSRNSQPIEALSFCSSGTYSSFVFCVFAWVLGRRRGPFQQALVSSSPGLLGCDDVRKHIA